MFERPPAERAGAMPSIRLRLANALAIWSLLWGAAVGVAVWIAASHEVDELLDDGLRSSAELLAAVPLGSDASRLSAPVAGATPGAATDRFAWQVIDRDGTLQARSARAPASPWRASARNGFSEAPGWRLYGLALGADGRWLVAAQSRAERNEARADVGLGAVLAALGVGVIGHLWLRSRVGAELRPLQTLSSRVAAWDIDRSDPAAEAPLGRAERRELEPVHEALHALRERLAARIANEQAFTSHAAHALRTPLAGIDAQLAVALRECPPGLRERLQRVRDATGRLQGVVAALLGLFRSGLKTERSRVDLAALVARLPAASLDIHVEPGAVVDADADLLAASLANLFDNAVRHGAAQVWLDVPMPNRLRLRDDGPGVGEARRAELDAALRTQAHQDVTGLGLMLADRVARVHGGHVALPVAPSGFVVELDLGAPAVAETATAA